MELKMVIITQYILTILIWGSTWLAIKFQLGIVDPMVSITYRFLLSSLILFIFCYITNRKVQFDVKDHLFLILQGILSFSIAYWCVYYAEIYLTSGLVSVISSCIMFFNIINGAIFLESKVDISVLFAASIGLLGMILIFWPEISSVNFSNEALQGIIIGFIGVIMYSLGNVTVQRNYQKQLPLIQSNAFSMAYGALFMIIISLLLKKSFIFDFSIEYLSSLLYLVIFGSVIAFYCYFSLVGKIGADRAAYGSIVTPVIALILSTFFEDYRWSSCAVTGMFLLIIGNLLVFNKKQLTSV
ncbi:DMT family transporter [Desulfocicer niacini]